MSRTSALAILASVGIFCSGAISDEAYALARAVEKGDQASLLAFVQKYPTGKFATDALILAAKGNGNRGDGVGNTGPGNQGDATGARGKNIGKGNAIGSV